MISYMLRLTLMVSHLLCLSAHRSMKALWCVDATPGNFSFMVSYHFYPQSRHCTFSLSGHSKKLLSDIKGTSFPLYVDLALHVKKQGSSRCCLLGPRYWELSYIVLKNTNIDYININNLHSYYHLYCIYIATYMDYIYLIYSICVL